MSTRPRDEHVIHPLRAEIEEARANELRTQTLSALPSDIVESPLTANLSVEEQHVATLGVSAESWRPISLLNSAHYDTLLRSNSLSPNLAKSLEAYKLVAGW